MYVLLLRRCKDNKIVHTFYTWAAINSQYLNLLSAKVINLLNLSPSNIFLVLYRYINSSQYLNKCFGVTKWYMSRFKKPTTSWNIIGYLTFIAFPTIKSHCRSFFRNSCIVDSKVQPFALGITSIYTSPSNIFNINPVFLLIMQDIHQMYKWLKL